MLRGEYTKEVGRAYLVTLDRSTVLDRIRALPDMKNMVFSNSYA